MAGFLSTFVCKIRSPNVPVVSGYAARQRRFRFVREGTRCVKPRHVAPRFRRLQLPQPQACACAIGCTNDMPMRERREIRGSGPARARVSRGNIHTYCGQAGDFRVSSEFEAYRPMRYMSYSD